MVLLAAQNEWKNASPIDPGNAKQEESSIIRAYMLPCLALVNRLMSMDQATDFIFPPNDINTNPDFWIYFKKFERPSSRIMCFDWIRNLLHAGRYETVDDFAVDVRHIWNNVYTAFAYNIENTNTRKKKWIENALFLERLFEKEMLKISRQIPNAHTIFTETGNQKKDSSQQKHLEALQSQSNVNEKKATIASKPQNSDQNKKKIEKKPKTKAKLKPRRKRKRQKLKTTPNTSQPQSFEMNVTSAESNCAPLNEKQLFEVNVWYEFLELFEERSCLKKAIMVQEGLKSDAEYKKYGKNMTEKGNISTLNMDVVSGVLCAADQCKIYNILKSAQKKITKNDRFAEQQLNIMMDERRRDKQLLRYKFNMYKNAEQRQQFLNVSEETNGKKDENDDDARKEVDDEEDVDDFFDHLQYAASQDKQRHQPQLKPLIRQNNIIGKADYAQQTYRNV
eukprot:CAMPEP_0202688184 /NCGR_PEP_ID=MMETSP1385-20130828/3716_1 /ASSEMBLY_ACC=CAM_ASM_000861 /TAXON_ID=933848 /ORGANISM="Elphidium margaritaceum" /LENGTH=449 /DNA_ID=CAMNT_0049343091 /DNA_START=142 /DNA_END=1491 /DNA_ORIENTATION=+